MFFPRILRLRIGLVPTQTQIVRFDSKLVVPSLENATKLLDKDSQYYLEQLEIKLPKEKEVGKALGKDLTTKIKEDLEIKLGKIQTNKSQMVQELDKLEMKKYLESIERLSTNKYALMHQKDEQKAIDRVEHVRENFVKMPYAESAKRLGSFDFDEMSKMDPKIRKQIQDEDLEFLVKNLEEAELFSLNHNEKIPRSKRIKYRMETNKLFKEYKKAQRIKYEPMMKDNIEDIIKVADKNTNLPSSPEDRHRLHLDVHLAEDVTAEIIRREDLVDEFSRKPWEEAKAKRYRTYFIVLCIAGTLPYYAYCEFNNQKESGGFQGVFLGMNTRVL